MSEPSTPAGEGRVGPGSRLGPYEIVALLGSGGMGEVFLALDTRLQRHVALKVLPAELAEDPERLARLKREARAASALNHPNIITVHDVETSAPVSYIAMEFVEGTTLRELILPGPLPVRRALEIAAQVADGLAKAHAAGIVHRDLKPENLMVSKDGFAKILDFGLARFTPREAGELSRAATVTSAHTETGTVLGTVRYMSPEQARGETVDFRSDQFSFGAILYEMLTGRHPFRLGAPAETISAILRDDPAPFEEAERVPDGVARITGRCLAKNPEARYGSTRDLAHDLREALSAVSADRAAYTRPARPRPGRRTRIGLAFGAVALAALLAALSARVWRGRASGAGPGAGIRSIAVLPLENLSRDPEQEYFADGLTEELITELAKVGGLRVISRTSVMRFKNAARPLPEIARALNVEAVVEGSVLRSGQRVRITAQLIDAATDRHLWADSYEKDLRDVLAIQSEAARAIARAVQVQLTPQEAARLSRPEEVRPEAYQDLLLGRFYFNKRTGEGLEKAIPYFRSAIEKSPASAAAYTGLAEAYDLLPLYNDILPQESLRNALDAALKAIEIDDGDSDAHAALAFARFHYEWRWAEAEAEFRKAILLNPASALAHHWYAEYLLCRGRFDEALAERRRARDLDPLNLTINSEIGWIFYYARRYDEAIEAYRRALELDPGFSLVHGHLGLAYTEKKLYPDAISEIRRMADFMRKAGWPVSGLAYTYAVSGDAARARELLATLERPGPGRYVSSPLIADVYAGLGEKQKALDWLEKGVAEGAVYIVYIGVSPRVDNLRAEPRFRDLLKRIGLAS